jgi:REP element-mobilizing transposase RayT
MKTQKNERLKFGRYYHIYNRGTNSCEIFRTDSNYEHFLKLFKKYIPPVASCLAWALQKNHYHFFVKINDKEQIVDFQEKNRLKKMKPKDRVSQQFSNLFNAYSKAYNKEFNRTGSLFEHPFERKEIKDKTYFKRMILYIHKNPVKHKICKHPVEYPWTSYMDFLNKKSRLTDRELALKYFDGNTDFQQLHDEIVTAIHSDELDDFLL